jgi:hypothetical protein
MVQKKTTRAIEGKTYSLFGNEYTSTRYYKTIRELTDTFLEKYPDKSKLLSVIQKASSKGSLLRKSSLSATNRSFVSFMKKTT